MSASSSIYLRHLRAQKLSPTQTAPGQVIVRRNRVSAGAGAKVDFTMHLRIQRCSGCSNCWQGLGHKARLRISNPGRLRCAHFHRRKRIGGFPFSKGKPLRCGLAARLGVRLTYRFNRFGGSAGFRFLTRFHALSLPTTCEPALSGRTPESVFHPGLPARDLQTTSLSSTTLKTCRDQFGPAQAARGQPLRPDWAAVEAGFRGLDQYN